MRSFSKLLINEWLKMSKKRSFFIPYAVMAVFAIGFIYLMKVLSPLGETQLISAFDLTDQMLSQNGLGQMIVMLGIICTAGVVAKEHSQGTIKFLLIRAQSRSKILASKYVTTLLFVLSLILFTFIVSLVAGGLMFGFEAQDAGWSNLLFTALSTFVYTMVYVTITFMVGVFTRSTGATIGVGMVMVLFESLIVMLLSKYSFAKYLLFANTNLSPYFNNQDPMFEGMTLAFSVSILAIYLLLFLVASFVTFKKRDIA